MVSHYLADQDKNEYGRFISLKSQSLSRFRKK